MPLDKGLNGLLVRGWLPGTVQSGEKSREWIAVKIKNICVVSALVMFGTSTASADTTLDFEGPLPVGLTATNFWQGSVVAANNQIGNNYLDFGVSFSGAALVNLGYGHAASGTNGLSGISSLGGVDYGSPFSIEFFSPTNTSIAAATNYFSITPDRAGGSGNTVTLTAYDFTGQLVGTRSFVENVGFLGTLELSGVGNFHKVVVSAGLANPSSGGIGMDLVTYGDLSPIAAPIPEPETYAMMLAGLGLLGAVARRRKVSQYCSFGELP
jgi:hypothetical protein